MGRSIATLNSLTHKSKTPFHDPKRLIILTAEMAYPNNGDIGKRNFCIVSDLPDELFHPVLPTDNSFYWR